MDAKAACPETQEGVCDTNHKPYVTDLVAGMTSTPTSERTSPVAGKARIAMGTCITCGNKYDQTFDVHLNGNKFTFDSFECAIQKLAPICKHCGCRIIGHGVQADNQIFCCAHCAAEQGVTEVTDRV